MDERSIEETTRLLRRLGDGDAAAADELVPHVYSELRALARRATRRNGSEESLQPTALVHEAWLKLARRQDVDWESRGHFLRVAAVAMRHVLVDRARARGAVKRGRRANVELDEELVLDEDRSELVLFVHEALEELAQVDERLARVAELRCFVGLTHEEIGQALDLSSRSVERSWRAARAWLRCALEADG